jgi:hypothetical protein
MSALRRTTIDPVTVKVALGLSWVAESIAQPPSRVIQVRWTPDLDGSEQKASERNLGLGSGVQVDGSTWAYRPTFRRAGELRQLAAHPRSRTPQDSTVRTLNPPPAWSTSLRQPSIALAFLLSLLLYGVVPSSWSSL